MATIGIGPGDDTIPSTKGSAMALDAGYIQAELTAVYTALGVTAGPPGSGATDIGYYTGEIQKTGGWFNDGTGDGNNAGYWAGRIASDLTNAGVSGGASGAGTTVQKGGGANGALINAQCGLLEDDIAYRLSLLAVNVLQPLKNQYPNIVVTSGFRQNNTGIGQHELGEAVDIQIRNQTDLLLYEVADYINKFLNFDQLILNWSSSGAPWIHVSFSPTSLRSQVLTKDLSDTFHQGLFLVTPLTGEALAAAQRDQATQDALIVKELQNMQARQQKLGTTSASAAAQTTGATGGATTASAPVTLALHGGPNGVQFDHDWTGIVELQLRSILATGIAGPDGSNGQAVIDQMNTFGGNFAGGEFQARHGGTGYPTYGFSWFYVSYICLADGTGEYQIVEFGGVPAGNGN